MKPSTQGTGRTTPPPNDSLHAPDAIGPLGVPKFRPLSTQVAINETGVAPEKAPVVNQAQELVDPNRVWVPGTREEVAQPQSRPTRRLVIGGLIIGAVAVVCGLALAW